MKEHPLKKKSLWIALGFLLLCANVPYGAYVIYPFQLFFSWCYESFQITMGLMMGGDGPVLKFFADASGIAHVRHPATPFGQSSVAAAGLVGSMLAGWLLLLSARPSPFGRCLALAVSLGLLYGFVFQASSLQNQLYLVGWSVFLLGLAIWPLSRLYAIHQFVIAGIGAMILSSLSFVEFQLFPWIAIGSLGLSFVVVAFVLPDRLLKSLYFLLAASLCLAPWVRIESLFLSKQYVFGQSAGSSDMALFSQVMFVAPQAIWALLFLAVGPRFLFRTYWFFERTSLPARAVLERPLKPKESQAKPGEEPEPAVEPVPVLGKHAPPSTGVVLQPVPLEPRPLSDVHTLARVDGVQESSPSLLERGVAHVQSAIHPQHQHAVANIPPSSFQAKSSVDLHWSEGEHVVELMTDAPAYVAQAGYSYPSAPPEVYHRPSQRGVQGAPHQPLAGMTSKAPTPNSNFASVQQDVHDIGPVTGMIDMPVMHGGQVSPEQVRPMYHDGDRTVPAYSIPGTSEAAIPGLHGGAVPEYREFPETTARDLRPPAFLRDDEEQS